MDLERYYELRTILQQWRVRLAESIRGRIEDSARWLARLRAIYEGEGGGEAFTIWLDRWCRQAAIQFILRVLFLRVLEDRDLLGAIRIRATDGQRMWAELTRNLGAAHYVQWCCWDAAHLLPDLFGPTDYDLVPPDDDLAQRFLSDVWRRPEPDRPGWLRFDFRPDPERADEGFQTRFIGDLYQELDAEIRERYAMLQTPHFISQFILEHTLLKRFEEKDFREVTLIDPTCGSGHFLVDAFWLFVEQYEAAVGGRPAAVSARAEIARTIIETHVFGCDINPYATALARFRLILGACDYAQPTSLRDFRDLRFNLVTIDSLIPYEKLMVGGIQVTGTMAKVLGQPEHIQRALPVLRRRYDVVVGNPPYITTDNLVKREIYREHYKSAYRLFGLSAPFTERFIGLCEQNGHIGLINSNAFMRRQFGKPLIESILPRYDVAAIVDLSGAYIPGHGTPTLILFIRACPPTTDTVKIVSNLKGEPGTPSDPSQGRVWSAVRQHFAKADYEDEFIDISRRKRTNFSQHPWNFGGRAAVIVDRLRSTAWKRLGEISSIGVEGFSNLDELFVVSSDFARRRGIHSSIVRDHISGEDIRDGIVTPSSYVIWPYTDNEGTPIILRDHPALEEYFTPYRNLLSSRRNFGRTQIECGLEWYEFSLVNWSRRKSKWTVIVAKIASHCHAAPRSIDNIVKNSATVISLEADYFESNLVVSTILNTSFVCFFEKQICFNKGTGDDPVRDRYVYDANYLAELPVPIQFNLEGISGTSLSQLAQEHHNLVGDLPDLSMRCLFLKRGEAYHTWNTTLDGYVAPHSELPPPFTTARELRAGRDQLIALRQDMRGRMIFLQEEMDWLVYEMYGLLRKAPLAEDYLSPAEYRAARLELGQRPFEVAGKGYKGDWSRGYQPAPLPESLHPLTEARIAIIEANPDIALLEDPLYKRRWIPSDYDKEFRTGAEWWLAEKLEWALEQHGRPISLREWARLLGRGERVNAALEVLTGSPAFDLEGELLAIIRANAAPDRPEHYLKPSGLRKLYATRNTQYAEEQGSRGAGESAPPIPQYNRKEFADGTAWKLRGKLNIPRERFIAYTQFDHSYRGRGIPMPEAPETGGPWFGWAGWDSAGRADALAFLLDRANRAGWMLHWGQCGLRASLRDLLPELDDLPAADRAEFEAIAGMCGIGLSTTCYCQAYRDGVARGEPGVPGVGEEALGVKVLPAEGKRAGRGRKQARDEAEQLRLDFGDE